MNISKRLLLACCLVGLMVPSFGQVTDKGNFLIGANFGFSSASSDTEQNINGDASSTIGTSASQFNISPAIGYFLMNNFALGIGMDYTFNQIEQADGTQEEDQDVLFGPMARVYMPIGNNMSFFLESTVGFGSSSDQSNVDGDAQDISTSVFALGIGPGFTIFSNNAIGIEALAKYNYARSDADFQIDNQSINVNTVTNQIDFSVGLHFYFGRAGRNNTPTRPQNSSVGDLY